MKFKKVTIQAFRAYNEASDGTFNFEIGDANVADFVSIYAPNGFGKTSFYDAVEYGMTKNIHRFLQKHKFNQESAKSERNINNNIEKQFILRNRYSDPLLEGYVEILTTDSVVPVRTKLNVPKRGGYDYKFDEKETINKHFKEVILSQEWIDAFLKEADAYARYKTFMEYFGDVDLDIYYRHITELINTNEDRINNLKKEIDDIQFELNFDGDINVLQSVNDKISLLKSLEEKINNIDYSFSKTEQLLLSNTILENTNTIQFDIQNNQKFLTSIETARTGIVEVLDNLEIYFIKQNKSKLLEKEIKDLQYLLVTFELLGRLNVEILALNANLEIKEQHKKEILFLEENFTSYIKHKENIEQQIKNLKIEKEEINTLQDDLKLKTKLEFDANIKLKSILGQSSDKDTLLNQIPDLQIQVTNNITNTESKTLEISNLKKYIDTISKSKSTLEVEIEIFNIVASNILKGIYPSINDKLYHPVAKLISSIEETEDLLKEHKKNLTKANADFSVHQNLNNEFEKLISNGLVLVKRHNLNDCPLCKTAFENNDNLSNKIIDNTDFNNILQRILVEKTEIESQIQRLEDLLKNQKTELQLYVSLQQSKIKGKLEIEISNILESNKNLTLLEADLELLKSKTNEFFLIFNGITISEYTEKLQTELNILKNESSKLEEQIKIFQSEIINLNNKNEISLNKIKIIENEISELQSHEEYSIYQNSLKTNKFILEISIKEIVVLKTNIEIEINELTSKINQLKIQVQEIENNLIRNNREETEIKLIELAKENEQIILSNSIYRQYIFSNFQLDITDFTIERTKEFLNEREKSIKDIIINKENIINEYEKLNALIINVEPYLKFEKAKKIKSDNDIKIKYLKNKVSKALKEEKNQLIEYINEQINNFFYEDLINDLYSRIDPHPDYKKIKFICDFKDDKPKLNVCVVDEKETEYLIPNLYFSTAQLNILSLSIFLAKALNARNDNNEKELLNCIFIDDPIQSMDSINILSTIDLLRSIVVNHKKQIILSTHDENFHNLLKKKMPNNLFNSKFIELETFGKVKAE